MIDIHCHILPDIDDGADSLDEALDMARMAAMSGVTDIVATPHFRGDLDYLGAMPHIKRQYERLLEALDQWDIPIRLHLGAEVLCTPRTVELASQRQLPTIGDTRYVLTEFHFDESFEFMDSALRQIASWGYDPIVAHPERYDAVYRNPQKLKDWANRGYVMQLNKGSVLGALGARAERCAHELLELGLVHLFASDAHSRYQRTPHLESLHNWIENCCDPICARIFLESNPRRVLEGRPMATSEDISKEFFAL